MLSRWSRSISGSLTVQVIPIEENGRVNKKKTQQETQDVLDILRKTAHFTEYAVLGGLIFGTFARGKHAAAREALLAGLLAAMFDETIHKTEKIKKNLKKEKGFRRACRIRVLQGFLQYPNPIKGARKARSGLLF